MRVIIIGLLIAASAALAYFAPVRTSNVAVFGRTMRPCPPFCVKWNGQIKTISRSEIVL